MRPGGWVIPLDTRDRRFVASEVAPRRCHLHPESHSRLAGVALGKRHHGYRGTDTCAHHRTYDTLAHTRAIFHNHHAIVLMPCGDTRWQATMLPLCNGTVGSRSVYYLSCGALKTNDSTQATRQQIARFESEHNMSLDRKQNSTIPGVTFPSPAPT